jgi:hypothetical protein
MGIDQTPAREIVTVAVEDAVGGARSSTAADAVGIILTGRTVAIAGGLVTGR